MQELVLWPGWGMRPAAWTPLTDRLPADWIAHTPEIAVLAGSSLRVWGAALAPTIPNEAILVGWSLGAQLALAAVAAGARPRGLVLLAATPCFAQRPDWPHGLPSETVTAFREGFVTQPDATLQRFLALQAVGDARRAQVLSLLRPALAPSAAPDLAPALTALMDADLRSALPKVSCPTLVLHGTGDALMPPAAAVWLAEHLPDARAMLLPDCGHAPHASNPEAVIATLTRFVETLS